jgi:hypothetical protein
MTLWWSLGGYYEGDIYEGTQAEGDLHRGYSNVMLDTVME